MTAIILGWVWVICWFTAIWAPSEISFKLFVTGYMALLLGLCSLEPKK